MPTQSSVKTSKTRAGSPFRRLSSLLPGLFFFLGFLSLTIPFTAHAETDSDRELLELYYEPHDLTVSTATRSPKPLSRSAENITVISADEIEAMNAHTLADVLATIPGVQVQGNTAPGAPTLTEFAGATTRFIQILIDGVPIDNESDSYAIPGMVPVQIIERVEVLKGPASSSWGSSLGGIVNVITKEPAPHASFSGAASFSGGENGTRDARGELSGTVGRLGYYLSGGNLQSNGFHPFNATENNNLYAKLRWSLADRGSVRLTLNSMETSPQVGLISFAGFSDRLKLRILQSTLSLDYALNDRLTFNTLIKATRFDFTESFDDISTGERLATITNDEKTAGGTAYLTWRQGLQTLTGGIEFDHGQAQNPLFNINGTNDKWGFFLNDTIAWERFSITPAVRYDLTSHSGDFFSPSIGATLGITDKTLLRAYAARGYNLPILTPGFTTRDIGWTVQAGLETTDIPFLWLKGTWFRNQFKEQGNTVTRTLREGFEIEARSAPLYNSWLTAGYVFTDAKNLQTDEKLPGVARHIWDLGFHYDDRTFRGALTGAYRWWNTPGDWGAKYNNFIWDLNLGWRFFRSDNTEAELFATGRNLFNGAQYHDEIFKNPGRWFEGGLRIKW
ncbi:MULTISPECIES: TonB-dependent receptor plug domain-containing protein [Geobacter]|uniref:Ligand-gated channel n=2 Tax=Geobacter TaxID=28231 RepID=A0A0C1QQQ4_9BACT|nr:MULTISPECIES: TonB-dependent receptor plug domain-containing protein [Geobacter]KIE43012.1 ligand-gated channel [Geobacter soli]MBE2886956.1 TonB-dependent receptor plug domain-containing protein [Geobacter anodireducens]HMN02124.1 TonB-dependent receptor plug domain-containing protein [Geobacter anodireducens]